MTTTKSNEEFLAEVEDFLTTCDVPAPSSNHESEHVADSLLHNSPDRPQPHRDGAKRVLKDRKRCRTYYKRRRAEREDLRHQVKELTFKLAEQQKTAAGNTTQWLSPSWKAIAKWQRDARLLAEAQQWQLCAAVDTRAALIHGFQTFLNDRLEEQRGLTAGEEPSLRDNPDLIPSKRKKMQLEQSEAKIFAACVQELDRIYAQTDKTLHDFGLDSTVEDWAVPRQTWKEDDNRKGYFLYTDKQTIASDFEETGKLLWQVQHMTHRQENRELFCDSEDPENTLAIKFRISTRLNSGRLASVLQRVVTRRYREDGRVVLAWRSLAEGEGMFAGMHADETGWRVATSLTKNETIVRTCMRHVPMHFRNVATHKTEVKQFTNFVIDTGNNDVFETTIKLESLLLKDE